MKKVFFFIFLLFFSLSIIAIASGILTVYVNNKPYPGKTYTWEDNIYVDASEILTFTGVIHSSTATELVLEDKSLQEKLYGIAVWIDYQDGRGNVISIPLKNFAELMGGRYAYYPDTNTVDLVTFTRTGTAQEITDTGNTGNTTNNNSAVSSGGGQGGVNPFNTGKILNDAQNAVDAYEENY